MLDSLDQKIIQELQDDSRRSNVDLAKILGVAESTIRNRIKNLLKNNMTKIIAVYQTPNKLGYGFISIVGLQVKLSDLKQVAESLAENPHVYLLASTIGRFDLIMVLILRTPQDLSNFMSNEVFANQSISRTETFVCTEVAKSPWAEGMGVGELLANSEVIDYIPRASKHTGTKITDRRT